MSTSPGGRASASPRPHAASGPGSSRLLQSVERHIRNDDLLVSWAPDFPDETANRVVELLRDAGIELTDA